MAVRVAVQNGELSKLQLGRQGRNPDKNLGSAARECLQRIVENINPVAGRKSSCNTPHRFMVCTLSFLDVMVHSIWLYIQGQGKVHSEAEDKMGKTVK